LKESENLLKSQNEAISAELSEALMSMKMI
jgi:hypothetical protein